MNKCKRYFKMWFIALLLLTGVFVGTALAQVNINVNIGVPAIRVSSDPYTAVIPGTYIYFITESPENVFFYQGTWWRPYQGRWHRATGYNGPWSFVDAGNVPPGLRGLPPGWRNLPPGHAKIKYSQVNKYWRQWEKERHWDKNAGRQPGNAQPQSRGNQGNHGNHGNKENKGNKKEKKRK